MPVAVPAAPACAASPVAAPVEAELGGGVAVPAPEVPVPAVQVSEIILTLATLNTCWLAAACWPLLGLLLGGFCSPVVGGFCAPVLEDGFAMLPVT